MLVWRICRSRFAPTTLDGSAGLHASGRFHHRGVAVVYAASSPALAALEVLVHVDPQQAPSDLVLVAIKIPKALSIEVVDSHALPSGWDTFPTPYALQDLGTDWLNARRSPVLQVPSALVPVGDNYLINPQHRRSSVCSIVEIRPFAFDPRLLH